jgi:SEC-C motif-containing protein
MPYKSCCQPLHKGSETASSAEQLMRSRYSAFCLGDIDYLQATLHPSYKVTDSKTKLEHTVQQTNWLGLKVIAHKPGLEEATVEFAAFYRDQTFDQLHELSRFKKVAGQWLYTDGEILPAVKLRRNDSCFCNSAKKYKKCHGKDL